MERPICTPSFYLLLGCLPAAIRECGALHCGQQYWLRSGKMLSVIIQCLVAFSMSRNDDRFLVIATGSRVATEMISACVCSVHMTTSDPHHVELRHGTVEIASKREKIDPDPWLLMLSSAVKQETAQERVCIYSCEIHTTFPTELSNEQWESSLEVEWNGCWHVAFSNIDSDGNTIWLDIEQKKRLRKLARQFTAIWSFQKQLIADKMGIDDCFLQGIHFAIMWLLYRVQTEEEKLSNRVWQEKFIYYRQW